MIFGKLKMNLELILIRYRFVNMEKAESIEHEFEYFRVTQKLNTNGITLKG